MADPDPMTCDPGSGVYDPDPGTVIPDPIYLVTTLRFLSANPKTDFDPRFSGFCSRREREIRNWICNLVTFCKRVQYA